MPYESDSRRPSNRGGSQGGSNQGRGSSRPGGRSNTSRPSSGAGRSGSGAPSGRGRSRDDFREGDRPRRDSSDRPQRRVDDRNTDSRDRNNSRDTRGGSRSSDRPRFDDGRAPRSGSRDRRPRSEDRSGLMDYSRGRDGSQRSSRDDSRSTDRPARPRREGFAEERPRRDSSERPQRRFDDRNSDSRDRSDSRDTRGGGRSSDRPRRDFNDRSQRGADSRGTDSRGARSRPTRDSGDRPQRTRPVGRTDERGGRRLSTTPEVVNMIDVADDIDIKVLPKQVVAELRNISPAAAEFAGRHLAAAMYALEDDDAERAYRHAIAARSRAARLACVREMVGLSAYHAQKWAEALSEFRTYQRLTGDPHFLPLMADCERGLGRPARALALARSEQIRSLDADTKIEMRIVASGARRDLGQLDAALATLECPELKSRAHTPAVTRLRYAYAEALLANCHAKEARDWFVKAALSDVEDQTDAAERATMIEVD